MKGGRRRIGFGTLLLRRIISMQRQRLVGPHAVFPLPRPAPGAAAEGDDAFDVSQDFGDAMALSGLRADRAAIFAVVGIEQRHSESQYGSSFLLLAGDDSPQHSPHPLPLSRLRGGELLSTNNHPQQQQRRAMTPKASDANQKLLRRVSTEIVPTAMPT